MTTTESKKLHALRKKYKGKKMVFCSGSFDLTHAGHVLFFEDCKTLGDVLIVGIGPDKIIKQEKGKDRPILNEAVRLKMVSSLKPVDYAWVMQDTAKKGEHPMEPLYRIITELSPDIYVINKDASHLEHRKGALKHLDMEFVILDRAAPPKFKKISTSGIIQKIKNFD